MTQEEKKELQELGDALVAGLMKDWSLLNPNRILEEDEE